MWGRGRGIGRVEQGREKHGYGGGGYQKGVCIRNGALSQTTSFGMARISISSASHRVLHVEDPAVFLIHTQFLIVILSQ